MRHTVKLPKLGDIAGDALVLEWLVEVGSHVNEGGSLLTVETDKVEADVPSPTEGTLVERLVQEGDEVAVGAPIAVLEA